MTSKTPLYWSYGKSKLPTNFYHHFEFRKSQDLISDVENPCTRISIKINLFSEFLTAILYTSFTIWNVWLLHRDQKLQKTPYTNFEHILTFCLTLNCHDVLAKFQVFWGKSELSFNFYRHSEFRKCDNKIGFATSNNPVLWFE